MAEEEGKKRQQAEVEATRKREEAEKHQRDVERKQREEERIKQEVGLFL